MARNPMAICALLCTLVASGVGVISSRAAGETAANQQERSGDPARALRGEWIRVGPSFACRVPARQSLPPETIKPDVLTRACLHMGPLVIGDEARSVKSVAGAPYRTLPQPKGATAAVYFLGRPEQYPYLVATTLQDRIVALQITGTFAWNDFNFNHIDLGAKTERVIEHFGPPNHMEPSSIKDADLWVYRPRPFSFEVKDERVISIRIVDPAF